MAGPKSEQVAEQNAVTLATSDLSQMSKNERIKAVSRGLFFVSDGKQPPHPFHAEIDALTRGEAETISAEAKEISKFHGIYRQQARGDRGKKTDDYFFMVRIKNPAGGALDAVQWAALDDAAEQFADGTLRLTSRQAIQYHRVYGPKLGALIRFLNRRYRKDGTLSACGDVNRNVMCSPLADLDPEHATGAAEIAREIAEELAPRSSSYFQIWASDEHGRTGEPLQVEEPIYGTQYLPRKFKIAIGHPGDNSVDALTNDIALFPLAHGTHGTHGTHGAHSTSWDLYTGGGLGLAHNNPATAAHLALYVGRIRRDQVVAACRAIAILQKEHGERRDRRQARWKYTVRRLGLESVREQLKSRFGLAIEDAAPTALGPVRMHNGWHPQRGGRHFLGLSIENGRIRPEARRGIREAIESQQLSVVLTAQQDLLLCGVRDRDAVESILKRHGVALPESLSLVRRNAMACPAKPTCGLAMTDAENVLPSYIDAIDQAGLGHMDVIIRMTGCPNNCARPPSAEIGIYGYGKNDHVVLVGGSRRGDRLAHVLYDRLPGEKMVPVLVGLLRAVQQHNRDGLPIGDFLHHSGPEQLKRWVGVEA